MKNIIIALVSIILLGLGCFVLYDKVLKIDNDISKVETKKSYEVISNSEIEELFTTKRQTLDMLNSQANDINDVKALLKENNNYVIEEVYLYLSKNQELKEISKDDVLETSKKIFGYELDLVFNDINNPCDYSGESIGLKYNTDSNKYEVVDDAFQCEWDNHHEWYYRNLIINKDETNVYTVTAEQIWTDDLSGGDISYHYYGTYNDAANEINSILNLTENELNTIWDQYNDEVQGAILDKIEKSNTYEYKIIKENGNIKVLSYKKVN